MNKSATFSPCRTWRYTLERSWGDEPGVLDKWRPGSRLVVIGLNPSTADQYQDDPTIRRCIKFAERWGYAGLIMLNMFAFRATDPAEMKRVYDPVGPENDDVIRSVTRAHPGDTVVAWGAHGKHRSRDRQVITELVDSRVWCLGTTKAGFPRHPLYVRGDRERELYRLPPSRRNYARE